MKDQFVTFGGNPALPPHSSMGPLKEVENIVLFRVITELDEPTPEGFDMIINIPGKGSVLVFSEDFIEENQGEWTEVMTRFLREHAYRHLPARLLTSIATACLQASLSEEDRGNEVSANS